jgi:hypothetical protein
MIPPTVTDHQHHQSTSSYAGSSTKPSWKDDKHPSDDDSTVSVELFGGAITGNFPKTFMDVSTLRQVPDNQEVWISSISNNCFIIEILQFQEDAAEDNPLEFFFHDLVTQNTDQDDTNYYCGLVPNLCTVQNYYYRSIPSDHNDPFVLGDYLPPSILQANDNGYSADGNSTDATSTMGNRITVSVGVGLQYSSGRKRNEIDRKENLSERKLQPEVTGMQIALCLVRLWSLQTDILITYTRPVPAISQTRSESISDQALHISKTYDGKEFLELCRCIKIVDWNLFSSS